MRSTTTWGRAGRIAGFALLAILALGTVPQQADAKPAPQAGVQLTPALGGRTFNRPICVTHNGTADMYVCEQTTGKILRVSGGQVTTYLNLQSRIASGGQGGLLCLAFHPKFPADGRFFVSYLAPGVGGAKFEMRVCEFRGTAAAGDPASERPVLRAPKKRFIHNAGGLAFGPDGMLYVSVGDNGPKSVQEQLQVQQPSSKFGKFLAYDVSTPTQPKPAPTNPWATKGGDIAYIYAYGFRNPWRFDWDSQGRLWTVEPGMKGPTSREWIIEVKRGGNGRWPHFEGDRHRAEIPGAPSGTPIAPTFVYGQADTGGDNAGVGGRFYKGQGVPALAGKYVFADYNQGDVYAINLAQGKASWTTIGKCKGPADIGTDAAGELYVCAIDAGIVYKITGK